MQMQASHMQTTTTVKRNNEQHEWTEGGGRKTGRQANFSTEAEVIVVAQWRTRRNYNNFDCMPHATPPPPPITEHIAGACYCWQWLHELCSFLAPRGSGNNQATSEAANQTHVLLAPVLGMPLGKAAVFISF
ncbi:hypothetical protein ACLKA6_007955 [Drosophila palustris]